MRDLFESKLAKIAMSARVSEGVMSPTEVDQTATTTTFNQLSKTPESSEFSDKNSSNGKVTTGGSYGFTEVSVMFGKEENNIYLVKS